MKKSMNIGITAEKKNEIEQKINDEDTDWGSQAEYIRTHMYAGESYLSELDPRINSFDSHTGFDAKKEITESLNDEYQDIDTALDGAIDHLAEVLEEMAQSDDSPVEKKPRKGFRLKK